MNAPAHQVTILMVEDDEGHARLIERNIRRAGVLNHIVHKPDGSSALAHLETEAGRARQPMLVLLDLNLPDMSGIAIIERMKADPHLKRIPVIVLTTTDDAREIQRCYDLGANVYITKPVDYDQFAGAIRQLGLFLSVMQVPETDA
jgi:CheY-like chemotaxis protein